MTPFILPASCYADGGPLKLVNGRTAGTEAVAIVECLDCERQWLNDTEARRRAAQRQAQKRARAKVSA